MLMFPPQWDPKQIYLSLPALAAHLRRDGAQVSFLDANIESLHYFLSRNWLSEALEKCKTNLDKLNGSGTGSEAERNHRERLLLMLQLGPPVIEHMDEALRVIRDPVDFFDPEKAGKAKQTIHFGLDLASAPYHPSRHSFYNFKLAESPSSSFGILKAAADRRHNPFIRYCEEEVLPRVLKEDPDFIGISASSNSQVIPCATLGRVLKDAGVRGKVLMGGNAWTRHDERLRAMPHLFEIADAYVMYEGEKAVSTMAEIGPEGGFEKVPNTIYLDSKGEVRWTDLEFTRNMNDFATPDFDGLPFDLYLTPQHVLPMQTSRGCYWGKCTFCSHYMIRQGYFLRKSETVVDDMQALSEKYGTPYFTLNDDAVSPRTFREIADIMLDRGLELQWTAYGKFERKFTPEFLEPVARAGCISMWLGLEAGNPRILELMDKGLEIDWVIDNLKACRDAGIATDIFCMVGFPTETKAEALDTLAFLRNNREEIGEADFMLALSVFDLDMHSPCAKEPEKYGISKVWIPEGRDLPISYEYETRSGMSKRESVAMESWMSGQLEKFFPDNQSDINDREAHTLLYRSDRRGRFVPPRMAYS